MWRRRACRSVSFFCLLSPFTLLPFPAPCSYCEFRGLIVDLIPACFLCEAKEAKRFNLQIPADRPPVDLQGLDKKYWGRRRSKRKRSGRGREGEEELTGDQRSHFSKFSFIPSHIQSFPRTIPIDQSAKTYTMNCSPIKSEIFHLFFRYLSLINCAICFLNILTFIRDQWNLFISCKNFTLKIIKESSRYF